MWRKLSARRSRSTVRRKLPIFRIHPVMDGRGHRSPSRNGRTCEAGWRGLGGTTDRQPDRVRPWGSVPFCGLGGDRGRIERCSIAGALWLYNADGR